MTENAGTGSHDPLPADAPGAWAPPTAWAPPQGPPAPHQPYAGLPPYGTPQGGPVTPRRSGRGMRTALIAVPALLVGAGIATVVTLAATDHHSTTTAAATSATKASHHAAGSKAGKGGTVGTLTSTDGSTWTVTTAKGPVTVDIGASTSFGSKAHPSQESAFHAGEKIRVAGTESGSTVDATRVAAVGSTTGGTTTGAAATS